MRHDLLEPGRVEVGDRAGVNSCVLSTSGRNSRTSFMIVAMSALPNSMLIVMTLNGLPVVASAPPSALGSTLMPSAVADSRATTVAARLRPTAAISRGTSEPAAAYGVAVMSCVGSDPRSSPATLATAQAANGVTAAQVSAVAGNFLRLRTGVTIVPPTAEVSTQPPLERRNGL
ncbi:hypothetical protein ACFQQB_16085 [Nonomuraea rubra]|uniref:hypothetical protein n=1 Tax=Nonomuraea rubra TaxID=46180 RepID=UPI00360C6784